MAKAVLVNGLLTGIVTIVWVVLLARFVFSKSDVEAELDVGVEPEPKT